MKPALARLILLALLLSACACAGPKKGAPAAPTPAFQSFEIQNAASNLIAADWFDNMAQARRFGVVDDHHQIGEIVTRSRSATGLYGADIAQEQEHEGVEYLSLDTDGHIVMPAHADLKERALSLFSPPLIVAWRDMIAGQQYVSEAAMRVVDRDNPKRLKEQGKAKRTVEYIGDQRIRTPLGEFIAKRVEVRLTADLRLADADDHTIVFIVPGRGVVAEQSTRKIKVLGAFNKTESRTIVLMPDS